MSEAEAITLSKMDVAERQLRTAIRLFFAEADPVSIETLACAATGVLKGVGKPFGIQPLLHDQHQIDTFIRKEHQAEYFKMLHRAQNFFKHADKDSNEVLEFYPQSASATLIEAAYAYIQIIKCLNKTSAAEPYAYALWYGVKYPNYLVDKATFESLFPSKKNLLENLKRNIDDLSVFRQALSIPEGFKI